MNSGENDLIIIINLSHTHLPGPPPTIPIRAGDMMMMIGFYEEIMSSLNDDECVFSMMGCAKHAVCGKEEENNRFKYSRIQVGSLKRFRIFHVWSVSG